MDADELAEIMAEPPGGENHGRVRTEGGWRSLQKNYDLELPFVIDDPTYRDAQKYPHGTRSRYVHGPCKCEECRRANREYIAARRAAASDPTDMLPEGNL